MKNINEKIVIWLILGISISVWMIVLQIQGVKVEGIWEAVKYVPDVISIDVIIFMIFAKWMWKLPIFQGWLISFPVIEGTWEGTIKSTWINPKSKKPSKSLKAFLVVRQSLFNISCTLFTKEMKSVSLAAEFIIDDQNGSKKIIYSYTSTPKVEFRDSSIVHDGTANLEIIMSPIQKLTGEYWTNRKTTGQIDLKFKSKKLIEDFPDKKS